MTQSSWTENGRSTVIFQRLDNICSEEEIPQKDFTRKVPFYIEIYDLETVNNTLNSKFAISENVPLSILVGVEVGGEDEGDIHQKGSCFSPMAEAICWRSSRLCGRPWRKRSMYLGQQRSMLVISSDSNSNIKEPLVSFCIF